MFHFFVYLLGLGRF